MAKQINDMVECEIALVMDEDGNWAVENPIRSKANHSTAARIVYDPARVHRGGGHEQSRPRVQEVPAWPNLWAE